MGNISLKGKNLFIIFIVVLFLSIPVIASHIFQSETDISTTGSDTWTEAKDTETMTITINVTGDYLNQTNITVPSNSSGYANYSVDWATHDPSHDNWTCTNETNSPDGNISKIICSTTPGNETQYFNITFDATAFNLNDSYQNWTIVTMDNNSETNTTNITSVIGISPYLFDPMPVTEGWTKGNTQVFYINVTDYNLNTSGVFRHWTQNTGSWPDTFEYNNLMACSNYTDFDYTCNYTHDISGLSDEVDFYYYFYAYDNYTGYGSNGTNISYFVLHIDRVDPIITVNEPTNDTWHNGNMTIDLTVDDTKSGVDKVWYNMTNTTWSNITYITNSSPTTYNTTIDTSEYTDNIYYIFDFYANDSVNNMEQGTSKYVRFDNTPPSKASLEYPNAGMVLAGSINLRALVNDSISGIDSVSFYNITEDWTDDGNDTWDPTENISDIYWNLLGTNTTGNSTAGYDHNWTFTWDTTSVPNGDYYLAINVTDKVSDNPNYNESATLDIASLNGNGSNSSGGIFVQVRNTDPIVTFYAPNMSDTPPPLEWNVNVNFSIVSITGINLSTIQLNITNSTADEYSLYEFNATEDCTPIGYINSSYFDMTFSGYNCSVIWYTPKGGEDSTTLDDQNLTLTASGYSIDVDNSSMKIPGEFITGDRNITVNNSNAAPVITLMQPLNPYFSIAQVINFTFYVQDNDDTNMTCDLYIDGVFNDTDNSVYNGNATENVTTLSSISVVSGTGTHPFMINCTDLKNNTGEYTSSIIINPETIPYIILLPAPASSYYNAQFHSIGVSMNATINNNSYVYTALVDLPHYRSIPKRATILYFDNDTLDKSIDNTLVGTIKTFDAKHVDVVLPPQHATPDMIRKFNTLFKGLNDDPYIDVSWGIVTGKSAENATSLVDRSLGTASLNQTTYHNYYEPDSMSFARSSAFAPLEQAYQTAAAFIYSILNLAGAGSLYVGTEANNNTIKSAFDDPDGPNLIYFAGGGKNDILYFNSTYDNLNNEYNKCPYTSADETVSCIGFGIIPSFKNRLVMFSTSDYLARISSNDTNASSWDMNNGNASDWTYQDSLILQMLHNSETDGPVAFIGSTSVSWLTSESLAKSFFLNLLEGKDIGSALVSAKNIVILNHESVDNQTTKDFLSHLESSMVLYGIPQTDSEQNTGYIDYTVQNIQIDSNPSTYDPITWNSTITISPKTSVAPLYLADAWQSTYGTVWYQNVTELSAGKINITFLAALAGEYIPDPKAYDLSVDSLSVAQDSFTQMTVEVERTKIVPSPSITNQYNQSEKLVASSLISGSDFIYGLKNNRSIIFAMPYSPDETLSSSFSKTVNISFTTEAVSIEILSVSGKGSGQGQDENNIIVTFNIVNPTNLTISNLELNYPIPLLTSTCSFSGPYLYGSCVNNSGFASQNISQVRPGKTQYTLDYVTESNMTNSTLVKYDYSPLLEFSGFVFNWGDNVTLKSSVASSSSVDAEIFTEIILLQNTGNLYQTPVPVNSIVWSNTTSATTGPSTTLFSPVWQVQKNTSETQPGEYLVKTYILENETSNYLLKNIFYVNITDELVLTISQTNVSSNDETGYIPQGNFNFSFTGTARKKTGKYLNKTVIGPSIYVYLDGSTQQGSVRSLKDDEGNIENIIIEDINPGIGNHTLTVKVFDEFNNTGIYSYPFNVTNIADSVTIKINNSDDFTANEDDWVVISGSVLGNSSNVFDADVTIKADEEIICTTKSTESGTYSCDWQVPYSADEKNYIISVDAISPLNITKTVSNSTTLDVIWLDVTIDPALSDIGVTSSSGFSKTVTAIGDVRYSEDMTNISVIENTDITCFIKDHLSWNKTITGGKVDSEGKYSCVFSSGLNHTGKYTVKISASKSIDSKTVKGYKQQTFRIIDTSGGDDSGSSSTSPGSISPSNTTPTETTANLNFSFENTIGIEQGSGKEITIMITNNRDDTLHNLTLSLSGVDWTAWYVITSPDISSLSPGASGEFRINISVPENADISDHTIEAKVTASESVIDDAISFTISVSASEKTVNDTRDKILEIEIMLAGYNDRLDDLFTEFSDQGIIQKLLKPLNGTRIGEAKEMLLEAKKLMVQSKELLDAGETIEAFKAKRQADILIADFENILEDEEQKLLQVAKILKILAVIIIFLTAVSALVGYMLLPPIKDTYAPKGEFFQKEIRKRPFFEKVSVRLQEILQGNKNKKHHSFMKKDEGPKGIKKIDNLHDKFKDYMKDDN